MMNDTPARRARKSLFQTRTDIDEGQLRRIDATYLIAYAFES